MCTNNKLVEGGDGRAGFTVRLVKERGEWVRVSKLKYKKLILSIGDDKEILYLSHFLGSQFGVIVDKREGSILLYSSKNLVSRNFLETIKCEYLEDFMYELLHYLLSLISDRIEEIDSELDRIEEDLAKEIVVDTKKFLKIQHKLRLVRRTMRSLSHIVFKAKGLKGVLANILRELEDDIVLLEDYLTQSYERLNTMLGLLHDVDSNKLNKLVAKLTMVSMIFLPLTLIASIYGMNFKYMPELYHPYGYFITLGVMVAIAIGMLVYFKKRQWI